MAKLKIDGLDETVEQMAHMGQLTGHVADEMLLAGSEEIKKAWQNAITMFGHVDTGAMRKAVGYSKKPKSMLNTRFREIYPRGKDKQGTRNAEKAFVLHYGRSNMTGSHFVAKAEADGEPKAAAAMEARWDRFIEKGS